MNQINILSTGAQPVSVMQLPSFTGKLASQGYHKCETDTVCDTGGCYTHYKAGTFTSDLYNYKTAFQMGGFVAGANNEFFVLDKGQHSLYRQNGVEKLLGVTRPVSDPFSEIVTYPRMNVAYAADLSASQNDVNTKCESILGSNCGSPIPQTTQFSCDSVNIVRSCPTPLPGKITPFFCTVVRAPRFQFTASQGEVGATDADLIALNSPSAMIGLGKWLYIADTGNNRVSKYLVDNGGLFVVAGNGQNYNNGENIPAVNAGLFHPKALAFDAQQNLYIATEDGYIKKVDTNGIISSVAGKPVEMGGVLSDEGVATEMAFSNPSGLVFDNTRQFLYVSDTGNHRIVRIDMNTSLASTVAGTRTCIINQVTDNEPATSSNLCSPTSISLDDKNNLVIVDSG
ncbi:MAG: hypothetical protein K2P92_00795, partial [Bdellovibrionaceae bacterium]|nr:hypothetical protein [Pseudobdellovibrionaceae bacterium]